MSGKEWEEKDKENGSEKRGEWGEKKWREIPDVFSDWPNGSLLFTSVSLLSSPLCHLSPSPCHSLSLLFVWLFLTNSFPFSPLFSLFLSVFPLISGINRWDLCPVASGCPLIHSHSHWKGFPGSDPSLFPLYLLSPSPYFSLLLLFISLPLALSPLLPREVGTGLLLQETKKKSPSLHLCGERKREERNRKRNNSRMCHGKRGSEKVAQGMNEKR